MLYALVNNDYQLRALRRHGLAALSGDAGAALIAVPHALSPSFDSSGFDAVFTFETPVGSSHMPFILWRYVIQGRAVARTLHPSPGDTLLFFTEVDWLNHMIVQHFRQHDARVILLEDGGFATYVPMSVTVSEPLSRRDLVAQAAYRLVPGLARSCLFKVNGQLFPRLPDTAIDMIAVYRDVALIRSIPVCRVLQPVRATCDANLDSVVFLNERMYDHYQTDDCYIAGLRRLLQLLSDGFGTVHFKFHPREPESWKHRIRELINQEFPEINIVELSGSIEELIQYYKPMVLASYFSASLLNIEYDNIEPLYLYHLLDDLKDQLAFRITSKLLLSWGYNFPSVDEVRSGYRSGINKIQSEGMVELGQLISNLSGSPSANINLSIPACDHLEIKP